jgi:hypothetical protein
MILWRCQWAPGFDLALRALSMIESEERVLGSAGRLGCGTVPGLADERDTLGLPVPPARAGGMADRSSRPHRSPNGTRPPVVRKTVHHRAKQRLGPVQIPPLVGVALSTVHRVLTRCGLQRLAWLDRATGTPVQLRVPRSWRERPRRREEAGQHPGRRRLAQTRTRPRPLTAPPRSGITLPIGTSVHRPSRCGGGTHALEAVRVTGHP